MPATLEKRLATAARPARILAVDDDPNSTDLSRIALERTGRYLVCQVNDPTLAPAVARDFHPDLVIMDVDMPRLDGRAVAVLIQAEAESDEIPILFVTSMIAEGTPAGLNPFGWYGPLAKPVSPRRLARVVDSILRTGALPTDLDS